MHVDSIGDELGDHPFVGERHADDPRLPVVHRGQRIEHVCDRTHAEFDRLDELGVGGGRVTRRAADPEPPSGGDHLALAVELGGEGHVAQRPPRPSGVPLERRDVRGDDRGGVERTRAARADERTLEVHAEAPRPGRCAGIVHQLRTPSRPDTIDVSEPPIVARYEVTPCDA